MVAGGRSAVGVGREGVEEERAPRRGDVVVLYLWLNVEPVRFRGDCSMRCAACETQAPGCKTSAAEVLGIGQLQPAGRWTGNTGTRSAWLHGACTLAMQAALLPRASIRTNTYNVLAEGSCVLVCTEV